MVVTLPIEYARKEVAEETPYPFPPELAVLGEQDTEL